MSNRVGGRLLLAIVICVSFARASFAFGLKAHEALSLRAVFPVSSLDAILRKSLSGFPSGVLSPIVVNGQTLGLVQGLVSQGSLDEDEPGTRSVNHFHDPTKSWDQAGFDLSADHPLIAPIVELVYPTSGMSSILWGQHADQSPGGSFSWYDARKSYYIALKGETDSIRNKAFASTFSAIGHLMHLIQDAAAPAHTRNDPHPPVLNPDMFHTWADRDDGGIGEIGKIPRCAPAISPTSDLLHPLNENPIAPLAIARLIDNTDDNRHGFDCTETDGGVCGRSAGIAEYSNAKFVSDDRLFSAYTNSGPLLENLAIRQGARGGILCPEEIQNAIPSERKYFYFMPGHGEDDYPVAQVSRLAGYLPSWLEPEAALDDNVMAAYGEKLFPRAIGYGAALINYFFRGTGVPVPQGPGLSPDASPALRLHAAGLGSGQGVLTVRNLSGEDFGGGTLEVYYDRRADGLRKSAGIRDVVIPAGGAVDISEVGGGIDLAALWKNGPVDEGSIVVVYTGRIGDEPGGVAARVCDCPGVTVSDPADPANDCISLCPCGASPMGGLPAPIRLHRDGGCYAMGNDHILVTVDESNRLTLTPSVALNPDAEATSQYPGVADGPFYADNYPEGAECLLSGNDQGTVILKYRVVLLHDDARVLDDTSVGDDVRQWTSDNLNQNAWRNWYIWNQFDSPYVTIGALRSYGAVDGMLTLFPFHFDPYALSTRGFGPEFSLPMTSPGSVCGEPVCIGVPWDSGLTVRICNIEMSQE